MTELSSQDETYSIYQQAHNLNLVNQLLKLCLRYEFNLPDTNLQFLASILSESLFDSDQKNQLYLPNLKDPNLQIFIEVLLALFRISRVRLICKQIAAIIRNKNNNLISILRKMIVWFHIYWKCFTISNFNIYSYLKSL